MMSMVGVLATVMVCFIIFVCMLYVLNELIGGEYESERTDKET